MFQLNKPDFLIIGPAKTGTTWLYSQLSKQNFYAATPVKELSFFNEVAFNFVLQKENAHLLNEAMLNGYQPTTELIERVRQNHKARRIENAEYASANGYRLWSKFYAHLPRNTSNFSFWLYSTLFGNEKHKITGDISPLYFSIRPEIIKLIAKRFNKMKVVMIIRDPVDREWSNIRMNHFAPGSKNTFEPEKYFARHNYGADYIRGIENWDAHFEKRMTYLFYDDLKNYPELFLQSMVNAVKPGLKVDNALNERIGKGTEVELSPAIYQRLLEKNMPQYEYLARKFGHDSWPAKWYQRVLQQP